MPNRERRNEVDLLKQLETVTTKLEGQLDKFHIVGPGVSGSVKEGGFMINPPEE